MNTSVLNTRTAISHMGAQRTAATGPSLLARLWSELEALGERRAQAELRRLSITYGHSNPALSRQLRDIADGRAPR